MPFTRYHVMSDRDAKALVAYMRTLPAIENAVEGNTDLKLPKPEVPPAKGEEPGSDPVSLGGYWVSLMHCAECHTPYTEEGPDFTREFAGGMEIEMPPMFGTGKLYTANLTSDPETGLGKWTDAEIVASITQGKKRDGSPLFGPMALFQGYWSKIEKRDMDAIVAFLKSIPPIVNEVPASTFKPNPPPSEDAPAADAGAATDDKADASP
jgi:hypothetical protein